MNYTESEILILKKQIISSNIPISFNIVNKGKIELKYRNDPDVYAKLTKLIQYQCTSKLANGKIISFFNPDFYQLIYHIKQWINNIKTEFPISITKSEFVESFSEKFYIVYQEAILINCINLEESAGMIFRKSLEILIKDFLLLFIPEYKEIILNETIGGIIFFFYDFKNDELTPRLKRKFKKKNYDLNPINGKLNEILHFINFVNNTFKLGNDFSHYERKLNNFSTKDLENNINHIIDYLEAKFQVELHSKKIQTLNRKFNDFKI